MTATLNGLDLLSCTIQEPRVGVWSAVVDVDSDVTVTGKVTLVIDGVTWVGIVSKGDLHAGRFHGQIVGGVGKLATVLPAKYYLGVSLSVVLDDLMLGTGETLSSATDASVRSHSVARWARPQGKASAALKQLADEMGFAWRVLRDGTVWLGAEQWPTVTSTHDEIDRVPGRDSVTIAPDAPLVLPGSTFTDRRISRVTTVIKANEGLRQDVLFEGASGGSRVSEDIAAVVSQLVDNRIDYSRLYPAKVLAQSSDGSLDVLPDSERLRGNGLTRVPVRHGIPGLHVTVPPGGKVLLFFEAGDPKLPAAALWPDGSSVLSATLKLTTKLTIDAPTVAISGDLQVSGTVAADGEVSAHTSLLGVPNPLAVRLTTHLHATAALGPPVPPTPGT
jgi:hypothetical protein